MRKTAIFLILTISFFTSSCSSSLFSKTKNKIINLQPLNENTLKIILENEVAELKFDRNNLIELFENDLKEWYDQRIESYVEELKLLKTDKIIDKDRMNSLLLYEYESKFNKLILKGKVEIKLKKENIKLKKINYRFTRSRLGQEDVSVFINDNEEIYHIILALGE